MLVSFREKFPAYHESVFQTLRTYKQLEQITALQPSRRVDLAFATVAKAVIKAAGYVRDAIVNWIRYRFYKK